MTEGTASKPSGENAELLADLLDEALALDTEARELFLRGLEGRDAARASEVRELIAHLPDPESREVADRAERGEADPFVGEPAVGESIAAASARFLAPVSSIHRGRSRSRCCGSPTHGQAIFVASGPRPTRSDVCCTLRLRGSTHQGPSAAASSTFPIS
jgi:broad specificity phosphatase PhoE